MLLAHGMVCNGGVLHCFEALDEAEFSSALSGYRYFGLAPVADLLERGQSAFGAASALQQDELDLTLDAEYWQLVPTDQTLVDHFHEQLMRVPTAFVDLAG
jgi:hypothetical protein